MNINYELKCVLVKGKDRTEATSRLRLMFPRLRVITMLDVDNDIRNRFKKVKKEQSDKMYNVTLIEDIDKFYSYLDKIDVKYEELVELNKTELKIDDEQVFDFIRGD